MTGATVVMANDVVESKFMTFCQTYREHNPDMPLLVIPYNSDMERIERQSSTFEYEILSNYDFSQIDTFSRTAFPSLDDSYRRFRLRKLAMLDIDASNKIYVDVDTVINSPLDDFVAAMSDEASTVFFASESRDFVYRDLNRLDERLYDRPMFSSGFLGLARVPFSANDVLVTVQSQMNLYLDIRAPRVYDQPLINFAFAVMGLKLRNLYDCNGISALNFSGNKHLDWNGDTFIDCSSPDRKVLFVHWAGEHEMDGDFRFRSVYDELMARASRSVLLGTFR